MFCNTFDKIHRMYNPKMNSQCKVWTLNNNHVPLLFHFYNTCTSLVCDVDSERGYVCVGAQGM